jgi:hypothetical protein
LYRRIRGSSTTTSSPCSCARDKFKLGKIIAIFNPKLLIELAINALDYAIGTEVGQIGKDRKYRPISFFLKKFLGAELNYKIYDKELLAIVRAIEENYYYLKGAKH